MGHGKWTFLEDVLGRLLYWKNNNNKEEEEKWRWWFANQFDDDLVTILPFVFMQIIPIKRTSFRNGLYFNRIPSFANRLFLPIR